MKQIILMGALLVSSLAWANKFPGADGTYTGSGTFTQVSTGAHINYTVTTVLDTANNSISTSYVYENATSYTLSYTMGTETNGHFNLLVNSNTVGSVHCASNVCYAAVDYTDATVGALKATTIYIFDSNGQLTVAGYNTTSGTVFVDSQTLSTK